MPITSVHGRPDLVLYTHRDRIKNENISVVISLLSGITVMRNGVQQETSSYKLPILVASILCLLRIGVALAVFPAMIVTGWMSLILAPFIYVSSLFLYESKIGTTIDIFGKELEIDRRNGPIFALFFILSLAVSGFAFLYLGQVDNIVLQFVNNIKTISAVILGSIIIRLGVHYAWEEL